MDIRTALDAETKRLVEAELATIPSDKRGALIAVADTSGARLHVAAKLNDTWKLAAGGGVTWTGSITGSVAIMGSW